MKECAAFKVRSTSALKLRLILRICKYYKCTVKYSEINEITNINWYKLKNLCNQWETETLESCSTRTPSTIQVHKWRCWDQPNRFKNENRTWGGTSARVVSFLSRNLNIPNGFTVLCSNHFLYSFILEQSLLSDNDVDRT